MNNTFSLLRRYQHTENIVATLGLHILLEGYVCYSVVTKIRHFEVWCAREYLEEMQTRFLFNELSWLLLYNKYIFRFY